MGIIVNYIGFTDKDGKRKILQMPAFKTDFDHPVKLNRADRQICCNFCHICHYEVREVLDGEKWCDRCQRYL